MNWKNLWKDNKARVGLTLFLVWLLAIWNFRANPELVKIVTYSILAIVTITIFDLSLTWLRYKKLFIPSAAIVSGFLIGLILAPTEPWWVIAFAAILASLSKRLIATSTRQHIFNPAAFGIVASYFAFGTSVSWWAVSWGWQPIVIFAPLMLGILWRLKRLFLPLGFLAVYLLYFGATFNFETALRTLADPTVLFFALIMLPEPITSPISGYFKYLFGPFTAIAAILVSSFANLSEIFLPALLLANLLSFSYIKLSKLLKNR